jgi:hypothetical protein
LESTSRESDILTTDDTRSILVSLLSQMRLFSMNDLSVFEKVSKAIHKGDITKDYVLMYFNLMMSELFGGTDAYERTVEPVLQELYNEYYAL